MAAHKATILFALVYFSGVMASANLQDAEPSTLADADPSDYELLCEYNVPEKPADTEEKPNVQRPRSSNNFMYGQESSKYSRNKTHYTLKKRPDLDWGLYITSPNGVMRLDKGEFTYDERTNQIIIRNRKKLINDSFMSFHFRPEGEVPALQKKYGDLSLDALDNLNSIEERLTLEGPSGFRYRAYEERGTQKLVIASSSGTREFYNDDAKGMLEHLERWGISGQNQLSEAPQILGQDRESKPSGEPAKKQTLPDSCYISQKKDPGVNRHAWSPTPSSGATAAGGTVH